MAPQTFDGIRVSSQELDLTPVEGEEVTLGFIQFTPRGKRAQETDKVIKEPGAHAWGAINPKALGLMGLIPAETGVPQMLMKAFANSGDTGTFREANFSVTLAIRPHDDEDPASLIVQANPDEAARQQEQGLLGKLKNLARLAAVMDERALLRGIPQGTMANLYRQVEVRRYETVEVTENGDEVPTTWMEVVGIA